MATIKVDISQIEDHLAQENSVKITSFSWSQNGYRSDPDIEWELDHDVSDLEYEDDDYVDAEEHRDLQRQYDELTEEHDHLQTKVDTLICERDDLAYQVSAAQATIALLKAKPFWKFW